MSEHIDIQDEWSNSHRNWYGMDKDYPSGMTWERSMFPRAKRDEKFWGSQDPLDIVPPAGPFDEEDGRESWRVSNGGRDIYTGDLHIRSRRRNAQQQERQTQFWTEYEARMVLGGDQGVQGHQLQETVGAEQFPDAFPIPSAPPRRSVALSNACAQQIPLPTSLATRQPQQQSAPQPQENHSSNVDGNVDGEYELDEDYLPDAPAVAKSIPPAAHDDQGAPDSTPPKTSLPRDINDWDDDNLLSFYKFKVIRKKGYEPMLEHFPGYTTDSLHEVWKTHRKRCGELGTAWRAAGKPKGSVGEWLNE